MQVAQLQSQKWMHIGVCWINMPTCTCNMSAMGPKVTRRVLNGKERKAAVKKRA
jgi:hypothetical protein